jgi:hypothetical protein
VVCTNDLFPEFCPARNILQEEVDIVIPGITLAHAENIKQLTVAKFKRTVM